MLKTAFAVTGASAVLSWAYLRHIQLRPGPNRLEWDRSVFGHRGCRDVPGIPENTIAAFQYAVSNGANGVELDVKLTKDKEMVVFHDGFAQPMLQQYTPPEASEDDTPGSVGKLADSATAVKQAIHKLSLEELQSMRYRDDPSMSVQIPTLEESVLFCKDNYMQMLIEIKERQDPKTLVKKLLELYQRHGDDYMYTNTTVISFSPFILYKLRKADPKIAVCQLHSGQLLGVWSSQGAEPCPLLLRFGPVRLMDWLLNLAQTLIAPWVIGVSMVGPKYTMFNEQMRRKWRHRRITTYLWGFPVDGNPDQDLTPEMRRDSVFIAVDQKYASFGALLAQQKEEENEYMRKMREEAALREHGYGVDRSQDEQQ